MKEMTAGRLLVQQGRLREALWSYWRASLRNNREAAPFYQMAQVYAQLSEFDKAIYNYDQAIARSRNFANAYHGRGLACLRQGDAVKALADIDTAIKMNRESNASGVSYSQSSASTRSSRDEDYSKSRARAVMALVSAHMIPAWQYYRADVGIDPVEIFPFWRAVTVSGVSDRSARAFLDR